MISEYDCLIAPVMTEKAMNSSKDGVYVFRIHQKATKLDVNRAVEKVFSVKVEAVNVSNRKGKKRSFRGRRGETKPRKLAIVRLVSGNVINFEGGV
ncbi:MAG: 50S ribosomal protein L23 [Holosporaceae bacterium]|jgi:large subunit ribosomal protein L23|nr:50S ribosomal protein L23 [Holosporaceae bacterium]